VGLERTRRIPDLTLSVGSQREREAGRTQGVVGVSVPLPLFDRNQGNLLSALRRADQARDDLEAERLRVELAAADAWQRADLAATQVEALRGRILPAAQDAYAAAVTGFELGKFAFTDVLDAQRTLFQARTHYLRTLSERYRALADLQRQVAPTDGADTDTKEGSLP
jgi:cobalt-zinc-cadmium efflux system outer membrane protein